MIVLGCIHNGNLPEGVTVKESMQVTARPLNPVNDRSPKP